MWAGWVFLYFLLGSVMLAWLVFPRWRQAVWLRLRGLRTWSVSQSAWRVAHRLREARRPAWMDWWFAQPAPRGAQREQGTQGASSNGRNGRQAWWPWMLAGMLAMLPLAGVLFWGVSGHRVLEGFDDRVAPGNEQVASLLQGEHLVPPPPLPPDVFLTSEVEIVRPMLASADRRWEQMDADFVQRLLLVFKLMKERHGYDMALLEGWRSPERQNLLAARGSHVTMAAAWQSYHQYGLAADCGFFRNDKLVISEKDPWALRGYQLYGQLAEEVGLTWGGRWQMMDLGHVEWRKAGLRKVTKDTPGSR
jgi:peptidoglycan L-alanyl-D-glutamate endopeptidase CwlK